MCGCSCRYRRAQTTIVEDMSEAARSAEELISLLQEYKQSLQDVMQFKWTSSDNTSDQETGERFADLSKVADEIQHMLKDGVVFTTLHTDLESGLRFFKKVVQKNRPDPVQPLGAGDSSPSRHLVRLSVEERRRLKRHGSAMDQFLSDNRNNKEQRFSKSFANIDQPDSHSACFPTHADMGCSTFPECCEPLLQEEGNGHFKYMLKPQSAGLYKCKLTGLMFKMETAGELEYHSVRWGDKLENLNYEPAGPLYNINCLHGSLVQIHFPHCEIISDGKLEHMSVAHITDNGLEVIAPKEITESHVVMDISHQSLFGLIWTFTDFVLGRNIKALVLLFLQKSSNPELHVLLLSKNAELEKVKKKKKRQGQFLIDRNPRCIINTQKYYNLCTGQPELEVTPNNPQRYVVDYENFFPVFTVLCSTEQKVKLILMEGTNQVWESTVNIGVDLWKTSRESEETIFFRKHNVTLQTRIGSLPPLLIYLQKEGVLNNIERNEINSKPTPIAKNQDLLTKVENKGKTAQKSFYHALKLSDPSLFQDLQET
ncbi:NACHT, LRR and PYD domains-containing protein 1b allele 1-like isoform X2 [Sardina pilchardus]|uniref:NACHT, LRR and PYD domains-containing protein 1b allele 1-like isoform X2 n=1 Tax=Sardina pilchardus TaxID=27697 RepID=UPI002E112694